MKAAMKSMMKKIEKPQDSKKKAKGKATMSSKEEKGKKKSKEKKVHKEKNIIAPAEPSIMGPPPGPPPADAMGLSTKNGGKRMKKSMPAAGRTVMMPVVEPKVPKSDRDLPGGAVPTVPVPLAVSPSPATSPHPTQAESPAPATSPALQEPAPPMPAGDPDIADPERETRNVKGRDPDTMTPDQLHNLKAFVAQFEQIGVKGLMEEFNTIKNYNVDPLPIDAHSKHPTKNRYQDIFCIDPTRVPLHDGKEGDYIHANTVDLAPLVNKFITTQGPLEDTVNDFWRLVVQENVGYIFMLCSIVELGKKKCEQYIPEVEGEMRLYGDIKVTLVTAHTDAHFINSKLILEAPGLKKRYIYHHYWRNWPDRGVPTTALAGLRLLRHARTTTTTTIVHCSAGVGRTGTLVAIEWLLQQICTQPPPYDMRQMLRAVRNQRAHAIQTAPQYAYVCFAIFRLFTVIEPSNTAAFHKFSADMQTHAGVVLPPKQQPDAAAAAAAATLPAAAAAAPAAAAALPTTVPKPVPCAVGAGPVGSKEFV